MIKAILFDMGRVIVPFDFRRGYARIEALTGTPASQIPGLLRPTGLVQRYECGAIESSDFIRECSAVLGLNCSEAEFSEIWSSIFLPETLIPESLLAGLRKNYRLVLVSNTNELHFEMIQRTYPLLGHFHSLVLSYEVGAMKPAPLIYQRAIEEAGCAAQECFFTDDMPEFVAGARQQGIDAVQFESAARTEEELRKRGVTW
jgi:putative hydrolase of the HAD superfamily